MEVVRLAMPVHNAGDGLRLALESACGQSKGDFTLTVLDDGSTDGSWDMLQSYAARDARILLHRNESRTGLVAAWGKVAALAIAEGGDYFAWVADHDRLDPDWLKVLAGSLKAREEAVLVYPKTCYVHDLDNTSDVFAFGPSIDSADYSNYEWLTRLPQLGQFAGDMIYGLMRGSALRRMGTFPGSIFPDRLFILGLALMGGIAHEPDTIRYRFVPEGNTAYRTPMEKQLTTLFNNGNRPLFPYLSAALHFLRSPYPAPAGVTPDEDTESVRLYMGLLHAQYMANNYREEMARELRSPGATTAVPRGLIYFMEAGLSGEWSLLFANISRTRDKLKAAYANLNECRARVQQLKEELRGKRR
jgi:glycosyltransferase involved in cell wall biosynthesis